jgi:hypothetical protein
MEIYQEVD